MNKWIEYSIKDYENGLLNHIDIDFIKSIEHNIPYLNIYYLTCMSEIINELVCTENNIPSDIPLIDFITTKATELYNKSDISEYLQNYIK